MGTPVKYEILSIPLLVLQVFPFSLTLYLILQTKVSCICDAGKLGVKQAQLYVQRITQIQFLKKKKKVPISSAFVQFLKRPRYVHGFTFIHFYKKKQAFPYVEEIHAQDQLKKSTSYDVHGSAGFCDRAKEVTILYGKISLQVPSEQKVSRTKSVMEY